ncbi:MAG: hypothetical protein ABI346_07945 [Candidatus Baltobacteraceae bacterium]
MDAGEQEGSTPTSPNLGDAARPEAAVRAYRARKRPMVLRSALVGLALGLVFLAVSPLASLSVLVGVACGLMNALLSMRGNERLVDHRSVGSFVFSSVLRILVFGIVPVGFGTHGPWWTFGSYFIGFFTPLTLYAIDVARAPRTKLT